MTAAPRLYHKIDSVFLRDPDTKHKTFLMWQWTRPEFKYLSMCRWEATEKVDGTNIRLHIHDGGFSVGGRKENSQIPRPLLNRCEDIATVAGDVVPAGFTLYGEGCGEGIQKVGGMYGDFHDFVLFDVQTDDGLFLERHNVIDIADKLGIRHAPVVWEGVLLEAITLWEGAAGEAPPSLVGDGQMEGWVLRPTVELLDRCGERVITKVKAKDFRP